MTVHRSPVALPRGKGTLFTSGTGVANGVFERSRPAGVQPGHWFGIHQRRTTWREATFCSTGVQPCSLRLLTWIVWNLPGRHRPSSQEWRTTISAEPILTSLPRAPWCIDEVRHFPITPWRGSVIGLKYRVIAEKGPYTNPRLSRDGSVLQIAENEIWIYDLARRKMTQLTSGLDVGCCPVWTPNGEYIAFVTRRGITVADGRQRNYRDDGVAPGILRCPGPFRRTVHGSHFIAMNRTRAMTCGRLQ